jgi:hypothetical protein
MQKKATEQLDNPPAIPFASTRAWETPPKPIKNKMTFLFYPTRQSSRFRRYTCKRFPAIVLALVGLLWRLCSPIGIACCRIYDSATVDVRHNAF